MVVREGKGAKVFYKTRGSSMNVVKSSNGMGENGGVGKGAGEVGCWGSGLYLVRLEGTYPEQIGRTACYELRRQYSNW